MRDTGRKTKEESMDVKNFIENYREAFGTQAELPIGFWYSTPMVKINGCLFKCMQEVRAGAKVSLNATPQSVVVEDSFILVLTFPNSSLPLCLLKGTLQTNPRNGEGVC